jgi:hypothetical protein
MDTMTANSDADIVKGCLDPKNWGCVTTAVLALAGVTAALAVAGHAAMGLL